MKAIFLNALKGSGKDSIADVMCERHINFKKMKFAEPLYKSIQEIFGLTPTEWSFMYENFKETPSDKLMGMSPRRAMVWLSEEVMKPQFGQSFYGDLAVQRIKTIQSKTPHSVLVFSDSGMDYEALPVVEYLGPENCMLVHIHRNGCDHDESRFLWYPEHVGISTDNYIAVDNNAELWHPVDKVMEKFDQLSGDGCNVAKHECNEVVEGNVRKR